MSAELSIKDTIEIMNDYFKKISSDCSVFKFIQIGRINYLETKLKCVTLALCTAFDGNTLVISDIEDILICGHNHSINSHRYNPSPYCPAFNYKTIDYAYCKDNKVVIKAGDITTIIEATDEEIPEEWWEEWEEKQEQEL